MSALGFLVFIFFIFLIFAATGLVGVVDRVREATGKAKHNEERQQQLEDVLLALRLAGIFETELDADEDIRIIDNDMLSEVISRLVYRDEQLFWKLTRAGLKVTNAPANSKWGWYLHSDTRAIGFNWRRK